LARAVPAEQRPEEEEGMNARRSIVVLVMAAMLATVIANTAFAAGGGGKKGVRGTIELKLLESTDDKAHFGKKVTFTVWTNATDYPWVTVKCLQNGDLVYKQSNGIFPTSLNQTFTLGPTPSWTGGGADCTAYLQDWDAYSRNGRITTIKTLGFPVYA
jgi:hypothetical protein